MNRHRIAVIPGDGIGPEVVEEALRVLAAVAWAEHFTIEVTRFDLGARRYRLSREVLPEEDLRELARNDAILLGAVGDPSVAPGILEKGLLLRLRRELDLYINLRPARLFPGVPSALGGVDGDLDFVIVRENTEGLYSGRGRTLSLGPDEETATEVSFNTYEKVNRLIAYAFGLALAAERSLTLVHKTNVLEHAGRLYKRVFESYSRRHPDVATFYQHVDAVALLLVTDPRRFQVIVTDNLFGDILSDLIAGLVGGVGFAPSGNIHPGRVSLFEPVHGSAPDIAGTGRANPIGAILSVAMMLRHLGESDAAERVEHAVSTVAGQVSAGGLSTRAVGELIAGRAATNKILQP